MSQPLAAVCLYWLSSSFGTSWTLSVAFRPMEHFERVLKAIFEKELFNKLFSLVNQWFFPCSAIFFHHCLFFSSLNQKITSWQCKSQQNSIPVHHQFSIVLLWHCQPHGDHRCSRTRDIIFCIPRILLPCQNLVPALPTMHLDCREFSLRCWCVAASSS